MFPDSSHYKKYNGSCFIYLSEILSKLQMFKVTHCMMFSDGLLILCNFTYKPHTFNLFLFPPDHIGERQILRNCVIMLYHYLPVTIRPVVQLPGGAISVNPRSNKVTIKRSILEIGRF